MITIRFILVLAFFGFCVWACTGCTSKTEFGDCIGLDDEKNPDLVYDVSTNNIVTGVIFFQLIAPPVIVALEEFYCPVGIKPAKENLK